MEKIEFGETIELEDGREFICFGQIEENGNDYVYLMSNYKPLEIRFAKQVKSGEELKLEMVNDRNLKERLLELLKEKGKVS